MNWKTKFVTVKLVVVVVVVGDNISTTTTTENCQTIWYHESKTKLIMWWQLENWISISTQAKKKKNSSIRFGSKHTGPIDSMRKIERKVVLKANLPLPNWSCFFFYFFVNLSYIKNLTLSHSRKWIPGREKNE